VTDLSLAPDATVPQLRAAGLVAARGTIVAFIEDHCACAPGWRDAIVRAHTLPFQAVGGPVDLASGGRPLDWAVFFYDYSRFAPPMASGPASSLSGANASYKMTVLKDLESVLQGGVLEVVLEQELSRRGLGMYLASDAVVVHGKRHEARDAVSLSFVLARVYASRRLAGARQLRRLTFACGAALLPWVLGARILAATLRTRRRLGKLVLASPWLVVLLCAWSLGEFTGYLFGEGTSELSWR
jgi:hypothetical protein